MRFATRTIHAAQPSEPHTGAVTPPIFQTSTFEQDEPGVHRGFDYSRTNNPTRQRLEHVLAALEGVEYAAVFASGLAAENAVLQALLFPGDEVVIPPDVYGGTYRLLHQVYQPRGVVVKRVDPSRPDALADALTEKTRLVWLESPTNPRLLIYDIAAICRAIRTRAGASPCRPGDGSAPQGARPSACGPLVVVDNTFATPVFQQPFELGADVVVHSLTKYIAGHSDVIQGAVVARDRAIFEPIRFLQNAAGAVPAPFDCWLTLRGIRTLELRVRRHAENAAAIASALCGARCDARPDAHASASARRRDPAPPAAAHPAVRRVYYPGLHAHPGHAIAARQMSGFGGMLSIELNASIEDVRRFVSTRRYFTLGESLGGAKSLICHPATMTHASIPPAARRELGLSDALVRLSPGLEDAEDLIEDLVAGLDALADAARPRRAVVAASA